MPSLAVLTVGLDPAAATDHQLAEQPAAGRAAPRAEVGVVAGNALSRLEDLFAQDGGDGDLDPFLAGPELVARTLPAVQRRHRSVTVVDGTPL